MTTGEANNHTEKRLWCAPIAKQSIPTLCKRLVHREGKSAIASTVTQILNKLDGTCGKSKSSHNQLSREHPFTYVMQHYRYSASVFGLWGYRNHKYKISTRFLQLNHAQPRLKPWWSRGYQDNYRIRSESKVTYCNGRGKKISELKCVIWGYTIVFLCSKLVTSVIQCWSCHCNNVNCCFLPISTIESNKDCW